MIHRDSLFTVYRSPFRQSKQLDYPFPDNIPDGRNPQADGEHVDPAPEHAAAGKKAPCGAYDEVGKHSNSEREPDSRDPAADEKWSHRDEST